MRHPRSWPLLTILAVSVPFPSIAQDVGPPRAAPLMLQGAEVPYAVRSESLVAGLAAMIAEDQSQGTSRADSFLKGIGLDPGLRATMELKSLALSLEREHPRDFSKAPSDGAGGVPSKAAQILWTKERYRRVGEELAKWIENRRQEGWAIDPLLDRLLNGGHMMVVIFSDTETELINEVAEECSSFDNAIRATMTTIPRRFRSWRQGDSQ